ncbi:Zinc finger CCCH domain-containing protein 12 [Raphanus sativus]|uniref:Zinc finger CCCH domain-containing protein 12 n=1 Tax=Raphanus sativus TaxID=3726 RepID=A0A6J0JLH5_RAPSA|nr:zinc finger CCCH domain-containing protein 12 [Raphanus sativus]KAJ4917068.1 Zinc finger CCCH domain-containing protein 12 [Raphanus sativus]
MSHRRESSGDVVHVIPTNNPPPENWFPNLGDTSVWATEDDYNRGWAVNPDNSSSGGDNGPPNKKTRGSPSSSSSSAAAAAAAAASNRTKAIGKMFFKTKLCCKFRAGTCPYVTNCNFAHTVEELRRPPPNWQEIVAAAHEEERSGSGTPTPTTTTTTTTAVEPREEYQIPSLVSSTAEEGGRSFKGRHCKKFYTEEGCPYGESCTFLHDEASRNRESVAISLGPGGYGGGGGAGGNSNVVVLGGGGGGGGGSGIDILKPSNWKTRICNKWEITGYCPFGAKCHFAHGAAELHRFGGGLVEGEGKDGGVSSNPDIKQTGPNPKGHSDTTTTLLSPGVVSHHADASYHSGVALQRASSAVTQKPGIRTHQKWKGPAKISRIYGDWIDDVE